MRKVGVLSALVLSMCAIAEVVVAQSAITGVVKDSSGLVLPGVTVEAASDVLIEGVRSVVTDGQGQYRIVDLRPGTYRVTYTLPGFQTVRREGILLPAEFTATLNVDLRVGELTETITVTGESPIVDTSTAAHAQVLDREAIDVIPTGRTIQGMGQLIVGINLNLPDTGGARAMQQTYMNTHGMTSANNTVMVDGMMVNGLQGDGAIQSYFNDAMSAEVSYQTSGIGAETSAGGVRLNMIPREGGNRFSGDFKAAYRPGNWQANNLTARHRDAGLRTGNSLDRIVDFTFAQGGPILKEKLWFFGTARYYSVNNVIPDTFFDDGSVGVDDQFIKSGLVRLTWQASPRNKFSAYWDEIDKYRGHDMQALYDPEEAGVVWYSPAYHTTAAKWTSTLSSRLMVEAGWSSNIEYYTNSYQPGVEKPRGTPEWFASASRVEQSLGGRKTAALSQTTESPSRYAMNAAASYVTGSHHLKTGVQFTWGEFRHTRIANADLQSQNYRSASTRIPFTVPDTVTIRNTPLAYAERLNGDLGIYVQDSWTLKRLTINPGLRWEKVNAQVLAGVSPAGRFVPERKFPEIKNLPDWTDWAPRFAAVLDVFGTGKTALKYSLNRYNQSRTTGVAANYNPLLSQTTTLRWRDVNDDDIAQGDRGCSGFPRAGCEIDFSSLSENFGIAALNTYGEYPRTWNLESGLELQHELLPRLSVSGSWFHGTFHNLTTTINQSWVADRDPLNNPNYQPITIYNAVTGEPITVYNRTLTAQRAPTLNLDTFDPDRERIYNAYSFEFKARPGRGAQVFGGISIERQLDVNCTAPDNPNSLRFCDDRQDGIPFRKNFKLAGSIPMPWGITVSMALQSNEGIPNRNTNAATAGAMYMGITRGSTRYPASCPAPCPAGQVILPSSFNPTTIRVQLVNPGTLFSERITQLDLKFTKTFRTGRVSISPTVEIFNVNNSDAIVSYVTTNVLNTAYLRPNSILQGRMLGVGFLTRW